MKRTIMIQVPVLACWLTACRTPAQPETAAMDWEVLDKAALASSHGKIDFSTHMKPVLETKCVICHNRETLPFFSMENRTLAFKAGATGPRIVPGHPESSVLILNATKAHAHTMPPVGERLTADEKRIFSAWVAQGAEWPRGAAGELHPRTSDGNGPMH